MLQGGIEYLIILKAFVRISRCLALKDLFQARLCLHSGPATSQVLKAEFVAIINHGRSPFVAALQAGSPCESGGTGRRARLRIWWGDPSEFKSPSRQLDAGV
ncbi:MAG TPA: hypothetical protein DEE98_05640 [Elusimicrobia bacterium]|nr:hypothetical protein [Elusimicrobiota bacterium]